MELLTSCLFFYIGVRELKVRRDSKKYLLHWVIIQSWLFHTIDLNDETGSSIHFQQN